MMQRRYAPLWYLQMVAVECLVEGIQRAGADVAVDDAERAKDERARPPWLPWLSVASPCCCSVVDIRPET